MPYSLVAWVTNQMHLIETVTVLLALAWWHVVRGRSVAWWLPLLGLGAAAFLIKEDGIMLIPCVVVAHWINRRINEPNLPAVPRLFLIGAALSIAALIALRTSAIGGLGGYGRPTAERAWVNYSTGLDKTMRLVPADRVWQPVASAFVTVLPIAALLTWRRASSRSRACLTIGFTAALLFNVPFALVTKAEQMHLVATGVVLMLTGGAVAVWDAAPRRARPALATGVAAGVLACATVARDISTDFDPFGPVVLANDDIVRGWTAVPAQIHEYLARKREGGRGVVSTNPVAELSHVIFGAHGLETSPDGVRYQWMASPTVNVFVFAAARNITIPLRHEIGAFREPAAAVIELNGRRVDLVRLDTGDWRWSSFGLGSEPPPHRIRISIDRVWHPARIIRGSNDPRALGLQIAKWRCADRMRDSVAE